MSHEEKFSDEYLNAFVDGQLSAEDKAQVYRAINKDVKLYKRVCELRQLRELVQLSYENPPKAPATPTDDGGPTHWYRTGVAAGIALVLGIMIGWGLHGTKQVSNPSSIAGNTSGHDTGLIPVSARATSGDGPRVRSAPVGQNGIGIKVLFHINSGDPEQIKEGLTEVENLLKYYRKIGAKAQVEVVANGDALALYRADVSPFPKAISQLQTKYKNLRFVACQNSIDRLRRERGIVAKLLPGIVVVDSGVAQIMRRQQQGWAYIQV